MTSIGVEVSEPHHLLLGSGVVLSAIIFSNCVCPTLVVMVLDVSAYCCLLVSV